MTYYRYGVTGKDRKLLVAAVAEILGTGHKYCGPPRYEFTVGDYTVDRDGTLIGPENISMICWLADRGFELETEAQPEAEPLQDAASESEAEIAAKEGITPEPEEAAAQTDITPKPVETAAEAEIAVEGGITPEPEEAAAQADITPEPVETAAEAEISPEQGKPAPEQDADAEPDRLTIEYPLTDITEEVLDNIRKMVAAKEPILQMSLGAVELPILLTPTSLKFPWFTGPFDEDAARDYAQFIACLVETAKRKKRVTAQPTTSDNFRFSCRVWLISLGMVGREYDSCRKRLIKPLPGNSGFRCGTPKKAKKPADTETASNISQENTESDGKQ